MTALEIYFNQTWLLISFTMSLEHLLAQYKVAANPYETGSIFSESALNNGMDEDQDNQLEIPVTGSGCHTVVSNRQ